MARIRTIKPSFWSDSKIVGLSPLARLLYIGMWNFADCDNGHLEDDPAALKRLILPDDDVSADDLLQELVDAGRVARVHTVGGRRYLHVIRLANHQKVDNRWSPRCAVCTETRPNSPELAEPHPNSPNPPEPPANSAQEGKGKERNKRSPSAAPRPTDDDTDFASFWAAYPRKVGKGAARKAWARLVKSGIQPGEIIAGAERYRDDPKRQRNGPEYTKHPGPWLNDERWTDQLMEVNGAPAPRRGFWEN